jgi:hypothetical protein
MLVRLKLLTLIGGLVLSLKASANTPDFAGHWQIDSARSQQGDEQNLALDIQEDSNKVTFTRTYREGAGNQSTSHFSCVIGGKECAFDEDGHKANVSLWFNGPVLVILKTNGPKNDPTVEWHLSLDSEGKTLTVRRENMSSSAKAENLVFDKTESVANR